MLLENDKDIKWQSLIPIYVKFSKGVWRTRLNHIKNDKFINIASNIEILIFKLLYTHTAIQQVDRIIYQANIIIINNDNNYEDLISDIRHHNIILYIPQILVFEYMANIRLREDQINDLDNFNVYKDGVPESKLVQKLMGSGKTYVLSTMLSNIRADGEHLSILVTPESLFETNAQDMFERTLSFFGVRMSFIIYERITLEFAYKSISKLEYLYRKLVRVIGTKEYIITTPSQLHTLQNSFLEFMNSMKTVRHESIYNFAYIKVSTKLSDILSLLKDSGTPVFDEVDVIFNPSVEHNFSVSPKQPTNELMLYTIIELYKYVATNKDIIEKINVRDTAQAEQTEKYYSSVVRHMIVIKAINIITTTEKWKKETSIITSVLDFPKLIYNFFESETGDVEVATKINTISPTLMEFIATIHQQVYTIFPATWKRTVNLHHGRSLERPLDPIPVPYVASNTPNERSEFANKWNVINVTIMTYLVTGISSEQASNFIARLKIRLSIFDSNDQIDEANKLREDFKKLSDSNIDLDTIMPHNIKIRESFLHKFNKGRTDLHAIELLDFVLEFVLPNVGDVVSQIIANPQNLGSMFLSTQGYSGTMENLYVFPHRVSEDNIYLESGGNGKVLAKMLKSDSLIKHVKNKTIKVADIISLFNDVTNLVGLIDIGAIFKTYKNYNFAVEVLDVLKENIYFVLYFYEKSKSLHILLK
eukprot:GHVR01024347.1.p1 GENE.GHVR01024347.1~~GHVR01024347.1.p1  ORF type:complete len:704 (-),score=147.94 GHVR01024347.1:47-2158(-)